MYNLNVYDKVMVYLGEIIDEMEEIFKGYAEVSEVVLLDVIEGDTQFVDNLSIRITSDNFAELQVFVLEDELKSLMTGDAEKVILGLVRDELNTFSAADSFQERALELLSAEEWQDMEGGLLDKDIKHFEALKERVELQLLKLS